MLRVRIPRAVQHYVIKLVGQWLATGRWFSPGTPVSSTNKTDRHDIAKILLKIALNIIKPTCPKNHDFNVSKCWLKTSKLKKDFFKRYIVGSKNLYGCKSMKSFTNSHRLIWMTLLAYSFRRQQTVEIPQVRTTYFGLHSLRYAGATLWNELSDAIRAQTNLNQFKSLINNWNGNSCRCGSCRS